MRDENNHQKNTSLFPGLTCRASDTYQLCRMLIHKPCFLPERIVFWVNKSACSCYQSLFRKKPSPQLPLPVGFPAHLPD